MSPLQGSPTPSKSSCLDLPHVLPLFQYPSCLLQCTHLNSNEFALELAILLLAVKARRVTCRQILETEGLLKNVSKHGVCRFQFNTNLSALLQLHLDQDVAQPQSACLAGTSLCDVWPNCWELKVLYVKVLTLNVSEHDCMQRPSLRGE